MIRKPLVIGVTIVSLTAGSRTESQVPRSQLQADVYEVSDRRQQPGSTELTNRARFTVAGSRSRYDFVKNEIPSFPGMNSEGSYIVVGDDRRIAAVNPSTREYFYVDPSKMLERANDVLKAFPLGLTLNLTDVVFEATDLGKDTIILRQPAKRWRLRQSATMRVGIGAEEISLKLETINEQHIATAIQPPGDGIAAAPFLSTDSASPLRTFMDAATLQRAAQEKRKMPMGMPLRSSTRVSFEGQGMKTTLQSTMDVTSITRVQVPADFFDVPRGFRLIEMPVPALPEALSPA